MGNGKSEIRTETKFVKEFEINTKFTKETKKKNNPKPSDVDAIINTIKKKEGK